MTLKNIKDNAEIVLISEKKSEHEEDRSEIVSAGGFYVRDGKFFITYQENADTGMGKTRIFLKIDDSGVVMRRTGDFQTIMEFFLGKTTEFLYRVPFGELTLKIKTYEIVNELTEKGGRLSFCYDIFAGGEATRNKITINVKKEGM